MLTYKIMSKTQIETSVGPVELQRRLAAGQPAFLLDVRAPGEYAAAHVPGAKLIPVGELDAARFHRENTNGSPLICCANRAIAPAAPLRN